MQGLAIVDLASSHELMATSDYRSDDELWSGSGEKSFTEYGQDRYDHNDNLTCAARSVNAVPAFPYPSAIAIAVRAVIFIYYTIIFFLAIFLNSLIIILISKHKKLQTIPFFLALQIIIVDLCGAVFLFPLSVVSAGANKWLLGEQMCVVTGVLFYTTGFVRTELMLVLVIDRFLTIFAPFFYPKKQLKLVCGISALSILLPMLISTIPAFLDCYSFTASVGQCQLSSNCSTMCTTLRNLLAFVILVPSCVIPLFLYAALYFKAKKLRNQVVVIPNGDLDAPRREWRAITTFFLMFLTLFIVTVPPGSITLIGNLVYSASSKPLWFSLVETVLYNMILLIFILDPIVIMRNGDVKEVWSGIRCPWPWPAGWPAIN